MKTIEYNDKMEGLREELENAQNGFNDAKWWEEFYINSQVDFYREIVSITQAIIALEEKTPE
jgi:hypothetical protein